MEEHIADVISLSAGSLYALCILRSYGMSAQNLHSVFKATVFTKLQYASPSWWGFTNSAQAAQRDRLEVFLRKSARAGFAPNDSQSFSVACDSADDTLFRRIISDDNHPLQPFLPPKLSRTYNLRARDHDYQLPLKHNSIHERNFLIRMFYRKLETNIKLSPWYLDFSLFNFYKFWYNFLYVSLCGLSEVLQ